MTYKDLIIEIANKCEGVLLAVNYNTKVYNLKLFYDGKLFFTAFDADEESVYKEAFHHIMNAGVKELLWIEGFFSAVENQR
jgi:hypothetical protein